MSSPSETAPERVLAARLAAAHGQKPKEMRETLEKQRVMGQLRQDILDEKVRAFLRDHAEVTESEDI